MKSKNGFTLIEVMVVLSILAIIAILAYNFFGGTMKEASQKQAIVKLFNDLRTLDDASQEYYRKTGAWPSVASDLTTTGILKAIPVPPAASGATSYTLNPGYAKYPDNGDAGDTTSTDGAWSTEYPVALSDDLCGAFNEYVGITAAPHDNTVTETYPAIYSCITWNAAANTENEIVAFFELD